MSFTELNGNSHPKLPRYKCHKVVEAFKIASIEYAGKPTNDTNIFVIKGENCSVTVEYAYMHKHQPKDGGYYVRYEDGYESYSPAAAFESGYRPVPESHIDRVKEECRELSEKVEKLSSFIDTSQYLALPDRDQALLSEQLLYMEEYQRVLEERLSLYGQSAKKSGVRECAQ